MSEQERQSTEIDLSLRSIKSTFETGEVKKMYEISTLYPTKIIKALGLNHARYINKLSHPEKFSIEEVIRFSRLIGVDHNKVFEIILQEAVPNVISVEEERKRKSSSKKNTQKTKPHVKNSRGKK